MATDAEETEIELDPVETAPDGAGNAQSAGVRPSTPFARAVDHNRAGDGWRRVGPARPVRYCRSCGIALPVVVRPQCENCGAVQRPS